MVIWFLLGEKEAGFGLGKDAWLAGDRTPVSWETVQSFLTLCDVIMRLIRVRLLIL